jgi:putative membrane protein
MRLHSFVIALALVVPAVAGADDKTDKNAPKTGDVDKDKKKLAEAEIKILAHLHHVNLMEIDMGKLAQRVGTQAVKKYGQQLVTDHSTADKELIKFAKQRGVAMIPKVKAETEAEKKEMKDMKDGMANLKKLKGADFDREYLRMMVEGHDGELAKTETFLASSMDADLDTLLENRKVSLQRHSDNAKELQRGGTPQASR